MARDVLGAVSAFTDATAEAIEVAPVGVFEIICAMIEDGRAGNPLPIVSEIDQEAKWWAGLATPLELEAFLYAIADRLSETPLHQKTRKRLLARLFKDMQSDDKAKFIAWASKEANNE
jgi:hypothetical protein